MFPQFKLKVELTEDVNQLKFFMFNPLFKVRCMLSCICRAPQSSETNSSNQSYYLCCLNQQPMEARRFAVMRFYDYTS